MDLPDYGLAGLGRPEQVGVELLRGDQVLQLLEARVPAAREGRLVELDPAEDLVELAGALQGVPVTGEPGQLGVNLVEVHPVAAVVAAVVAEAELAAGEDRRHRVGDLLDLVVLRAVADV